MAGPHSHSEGPIPHEGGRRAPRPTPGGAVAGLRPRRAGRRRRRPKRPGTHTRRRPGSSCRPAGRRPPSGRRRRVYACKVYDGDPRRTSRSLHDRGFSRPFRPSGGTHTNDHPTSDPFVHPSHSSTHAPSEEHSGPPVQVRPTREGPWSPRRCSSTPRAGGVVDCLPLSFYSRTCGFWVTRPPTRPTSLSRVHSGDVDLDIPRVLRGRRHPQRGQTLYSFVWVSPPV